MSAKLVTYNRFNDWFTENLYYLDSEFLEANICTNF